MNGTEIGTTTAPKDDIAKRTSASMSILHSYCCKFRKTHTSILERESCYSCIAWANSIGGYLGKDIKKVQRISGFIKAQETFARTDLLFSA